MSKLVRLNDRPPTTPQPAEWSDFEKYLRAGRNLAEGFDYMYDNVWNADTSTPPSAKQLADMKRKANDDEYWSCLGKNFEIFKAGKTLYEHPDYYRNKGCIWDEDKLISRDFVVKKIAMFLGALPNVNPHNAEIYTQTLVEVVVAQNPYASALEATYREMVRTMRFAPAVPELLEILIKHEKEFYHIMLAHEESDLGCWRRDAFKVAEYIPPPAPPPPPPRTGPIVEGERVQHQGFGTGTVSKVDGCSLVVKFYGVLRETRIFVGDVERV